MASPITEERSELPSPKTCNDSDLEDPYYDSDDIYEGTAEERQQFEDQCTESEGYEMDFSKYSYRNGWRAVDLEDNILSYHENDRDLMNMLAHLALTDRNAKNGTSLEMGKILRANYHPSAGVTLYISFEVNDPSESDGNQTKPYRAMVRYLCRDGITLISCDPKPSP